ncbi:MAG: hypothetical protein U5N26_08980 [Candidatus Marinimicrobia bacterium]|nr:hypothetical protein [Candidatus Neomarinimicrobiota bacterium]
MADIGRAGWCEYIVDLAAKFNLLGVRSVFDTSLRYRDIPAPFPGGSKIRDGHFRPDDRRGKKKLYPGIPFFTGNMLRPPVMAVDLYLNLHDSLNYIARFSDISAHIAYMDRILGAEQAAVFSISPRRR